MSNKRTEVTRMKKTNNLARPGTASMMRPPKRKLNVGVFKRAIKMLFSYYPVMIPICIACIIFAAITSAIPAIFLKEVTNAIYHAVENSVAWETAKHEIIPKVPFSLAFMPFPLLPLHLKRN